MEMADILVIWPGPTVYANFVVLLFKMIHIVFQGNRHSSSGKDFLPYGGRLGHVIWTKYMYELFLPFRRSPLKILTDNRHIRDCLLRSLNDLSL